MIEDDFDGERTTGLTSESPANRSTFGRLGFGYWSYRICVNLLPSFLLTIFHVDDPTHEALSRRQSFELGPSRRSVGAISFRNTVPTDQGTCVQNGDCRGPQQFFSSGGFSAIARSDLQSMPPRREPLPRVVRCPLVWVRFVGERKTISPVVGNRSLGLTEVARRTISCSLDVNRESSSLPVRCASHDRESRVRVGKGQLSVRSS